MSRKLPQAIKDLGRNLILMIPLMIAVNLFSYFNKENILQSYHLIWQWVLILLSARLYGANAS